MLGEFSAEERRDSPEDNQEEDKRATTNVQHRFVLLFLLSFNLFCSP